MDDFATFYKDYGESLARRLAAIGHSDLTPAYVFVEEMGDATEVESFVSKFPGEPRPFLVLENFSEVVNSQRDNYHAEIRGSLAILVKGRDKAAKRQAIADSRIIILKALALMIQDDRFGRLNENGISLESDDKQLPDIGPFGTSWYGKALEFTMLVPLNLELTDDDLLADN